MVKVTEKEHMAIVARLRKIGRETTKETQFTVKHTTKKDKVGIADFTISLFPRNGAYFHHLPVVAHICDIYGYKPFVGLTLEGKICVHMFAIVG